MEWSTALTILGVTAIVLGAVTELVRTRTPRAWWYDLDKRVALLEQAVEDLKGKPE
jgi:hypothetical protein